MRINHGYSITDCRLHTQIHFAKEKGQTRKIAKRLSDNKKVVVDYYKTDGLPDGYKLYPWYYYIWGDWNMEIPMLILRIFATVALGIELILMMLLYIPTLGWSWRWLNKMLGEDD